MTNFIKKVTSIGIILACINYSLFTI